MAKKSKGFSELITAKKKKEQSFNKLIDRVKNQTSNQENIKIISTPKGLPKMSEQIHKLIGIYVDEDDDNEQKC